MEELSPEQLDGLHAELALSEIMQYFLEKDKHFLERVNNCDEDDHKNYNEKRNDDVSKLTLLDIGDYKVIWLHSEDTLREENRSWIETRLHIMFPQIEIFSSNDSCLAFLESLPIESKLFFLGNGTEPERFNQVAMRFAFCHILWNRSSAHTLKSFILLQDTIIKHCDEDDEREDQTLREKQRQRMNDYAVILLTKHTVDESFKDIQHRMSTVFDRLMIFDLQENFLDYIESNINVETPIFLVAFDYADVEIPKTTKTINAAIYYLHSKTTQLSKQHYNDVEKLIVALRRDIRALIDDFPFTSIEYSLRGLDPKRAPYTSFVGFMDVFIGLTRDSDRHIAQKDFLESCRKAYTDNLAYLQTIDRFAQEYQSFEQAIAWYTRDSFVYRLVNQAMRSQNPDIVHQYRFFINDLIHHLSKLHEAAKQNPLVDPNLIVYRGQGMRLKEMNKLKRHIGKQFALNSFYSTTLDRDMAVEFALLSTNGHDILSVLVVLNLNQTLVYVRPFASVEHLSTIPEEKEVLISMGSVFHLESITFNESMQLWTVNMTLIEFDKDDVRSLKIDPITHQVSLEAYRTEERCARDDDSVAPMFAAAMHDTMMVNEYRKLEKKDKETIQQEADRLKEDMEDIFQIYGKRN